MTPLADLDNAVEELVAQSLRAWRVDGDVARGPDGGLHVSAGQIEMWKKTGGPPPNIKLWPKLAAEDKDFKSLLHAVFEQKPITHSAYYFAEWPAVHKAYSDMVIATMSGKREDIPKVLADHVDKIRNAAQGK